MAAARRSTVISPGRLRLEGRLPRPSAYSKPAVRGRSLSCPVSELCPPRPEQPFAMQLSALASGLRGQVAVESACYQAAVTGAMQQGQADGRRQLEVLAGRHRVQA